MRPRVVTALLVTSLLANVVLAVSASVLFDRTTTLQERFAEDARRDHQVSNHIYERLHEIETTAGLLRFERAMPRTAEGDCGGVPVTFSATLNRLPADAAVFLAVRATHDLLERETFRHGTALGGEWVEHPAHLTADMTFTVNVTLPDLTVYEYQWVVRGSLVERSADHSLHVGGGGGWSFMDARPYYADASEGEKRVEIRTSPNTPNCPTRVAEAAVIAPVPGGETRLPLERNGDSGLHWAARIPDVRYDADGDWAVDWTLADGSVVRWELDAPLA